MQKSHLYLLKQLQSLGADLKEEDKEFSGQSLQHYHSCKTNAESVSTSTKDTQTLSII